MTQLERVAGSPIGAIHVAHGRVLPLEESEKEAEKLLNKEGFVSRCDLNHLLATSLRGWTASSRMCDREAGRVGSSGLTLGLYVYGPKVGLTKSCLERANLTKLINLYLKQNTLSGFLDSAQSHLQL